MFFDKKLLNKILNLRSLNVLIHGTNTNILHLPYLENKNVYGIEYKQLADIYMIDNSITNKSDICQLISQLSSDRKSVV